MMRYVRYYSDDIIKAIGILALTFFVLSINYYFLSHDFSFHHLPVIILIPVVAACFLFPVAGMGFTILISAAYIVLISLFSTDTVTISNAIIRSGTFILVGLIISYLSFISKRNHCSLQGERDLLESSLREKNLLLAEVRHRVMNNLLTIRAFLDMESTQARNEEVRDSIENLDRRIQMLALVQGEMYSNELDSLRADDFIDKLIQYTLESYDHVDIEGLTVDADPIPLSPGSAINVGLLIIELVGNSVEHAFPDGRIGEILVSFKDEGGKLILRIEDDGVGIPDTLDPMHSDSGGFKMVRTVVKIVGAVATLERKNGTRWTIRF